jgi:ankyrin repeat protein
VKVLLAKGADVKARTSLGGSTALQLAASNGHADVVQILKTAENDAIPK